MVYIRISISEQNETKHSWQETLVKDSGKCQFNDTNIVTFIHHHLSFCELSSSGVASTSFWTLLLRGCLVIVCRVLPFLSSSIEHEDDRFLVSVGCFLGYQQPIQHCVTHWARRDEEKSPSTNEVSLLNILKVVINSRESSRLLSHRCLDVSAQSDRLELVCHC